MTMINKVNIHGAHIDNVSISEAVERIELLIKNGIPAYVVTPNIDHIVKIRKDEGFKKVYDNAALVLADGAPVLWAARFLGTPLKGRVSGADLFPKLCERASQEEHALFLLGGNPGSASKTSEILRARYPGLRITGLYSPPFGFENDKVENKKIIEMIRSAKPDILFVGLGTPKQEKWIYQYYRELAVPVSIGIGAAFEFISGAVKRAPLWMQRAGLEWLWRLAMEPKRLWKRYLIDDPKFFRMVLQQKIRK